MIKLMFQDVRPSMVGPRHPDFHQSTLEKSWPKAHFIEAGGGEGLAGHHTASTRQSGLLTLSSGKVNSLVSPYE